ncbi:helicase associated domain-containing protein [Streptomyces sp. NPDC058385]|uniref:helicase associated domain-containing protein n=1 Tax=Streptomyces sp. NPDC058385 TaxID=3346473 RepID=UPI00364D723D
MLAEEAGLTELQPGVTVHGMNIGRWLARQRKPEVWTALTDGQRECLEVIGITPQAPAPEEEAEAETPSKPSKTASGAFERGVAALAQYKAREGHLTVPRGHVEQLDDGSEVRLGVWLTNIKTRRAKLGDDKITALADLGLDWASATA